MKRIPTFAFLSITPKRGGFTLLEILLTMALLVAVAALVWPNLLTTLDRDRLSNAAADVQAVLLSAKMRAMEEGRIYYFAFTNESNTYILYPEGETPNPTDSDTVTPAANNLTDTTLRREYDQDWASANGYVPRQLPDGIRFTLADTAQAATNDQMRAAAEVASAWDQQIRFFPDGTSTAGHFHLRDQTAAMYELTVRPLTGTVLLRRRLPGVTDNLDSSN